MPDEATSAPADLTQECLEPRMGRQNIAGAVSPRLAWLVWAGILGVAHLEHCDGWGIAMAGTYGPRSTLSPFQGVKAVVLEAS